MDFSPPVLQVSQVIEFCNSLFSELEFQVEGEVANYSVSRGKFVFFDLKDEQVEARLSCFMMLHQQTIPLEDGMRVVVRARPSLFTKSGKFSLTIQRVEAKGEGSLKRAYELLLAKLEKEGLFAESRKRPLPRFPQHVGVISSAGAAGYGDFMRIIAGRLQGVEFILGNVAVQGNDAVEEICLAFDHLNSRFNLDVIVLIRGGGSMEDLHAFNSEPVARAVARSKAPVVVGVGHERDVTIADFCADVRAATPSNAAQLLLPTTEEVMDLVFRLTSSGREQVQRTLLTRRQAVAAQLQGMRLKLGYTLQTAKQKVEALCRTIDAISPQATLQRGYTLTSSADGKLIHSAKKIKKGESLLTRFADGTVSSTVS